MKPAEIAAQNNPSHALALDTNGEWTTRKKFDDLGGSHHGDTRSARNLIASARCSGVIFGN
jgi:hypothetical protein